MKKKGEITSQQIVILVIVIASFAVILFFLFRLNLGETTDEELCHNSVLTRGSAVVATEAVPLNCHRQYICLTAKGGTCEGLTNPKRIEVSTLDEVYGKLADQMANCWWMFGEGRVNYVGGDKISNNYCSICSQVYFDKSLENVTGEKIEQDKLYNYLEKTKIDDTNTYAQYLFGGKSVDDLKKDLLDREDVGTFGTIEIDKHYFILTGIISESEWFYSTGEGVLASVGLRTIGSVLVKFTPLLTTNPIGWIAGGIIVVGSTVAGIAADSYEPSIVAVILDGRGIDNRFMAPTIIEANSEKFDALNCEEILTLA